MGWLSWLAGARSVDAAPAIDAYVTQQAYNAELHRTAAYLDSIENVLTGLGGHGDKSQANTVRPQRRLTEEERAQLYREPIMRAGIDIAAGDATRRGWRVLVEDEDDDPLAQVWQGLGVVSAMRRAVAWAMAQGGALIVMVTDDAPGQDALRAPLRAGAEVLRLEVFEKREFTHGEIVRDITREGYRRPETWLISPRQGGFFEAHASRVLYIPGEDVLPADLEATGYIGESYIDLVFQRLAAYIQTLNAGSIMSQEMKQAIVKIAGLAGLETGAAAELFKLRMRAMMQQRSLRGAMILDESDEFHQQTTPATGFKELDEAARIALCAAMRRPATRLFGIAPAGFSSDDKAQKENLNKDVSDIQQERIRPALEQLARVCFAAMGEEPADWSIDFEPLDEPTEQEWADIELKHAQADAVRINSGVLDPDHVARSRFGEAQYGTRILPMDDTQIAALEDPDLPTDEDMEILR